MTTQRITIQLQGSDDDGGHLRLTDLIQQLEAIRTALKHTERLVTGTETRALYYRVIDLSHNSPATVVLEAVLTNPQLRANIASRTVNSFFRNLRQINDKGRVPSRVDVPTLESYQALGSGLNKNVRHIKLTNDHASIEINEPFQEKVAEIIGPDEIIEGSLTGMLEWLNIHNNINVFHIYPITGPRKVSCHFTKEWRETVIRGIDKNVTVYGQLRYKMRDNFPYAINVSDIEIHPDESDLPTLASLRGMTVNQTGLSAADFIRSLRDGEYQ
jgi:hypothetical protein